MDEREGKGGGVAPPLRWVYFYRIHPVQIFFNQNSDFACLRYIAHLFWGVVRVGFGCYFVKIFRLFHFVGFGWIELRCVLRYVGVGLCHVG